MVLYDTDAIEVEQIMENLVSKSSFGVDYISSNIVKITSSITAPHLTSLLNHSFDEGNFRSELSKAKVYALLKGGDKLNENNYRPISLLTVWSTIFERVMYKRIYLYFENFTFSRKALLFSRKA